ncbi:MAG: hypothetical protein HW416_2685 [Chloroflexi bacterium]|nr:hypothetical protein [Chloroflexota bacterium]
MGRFDRSASLIISLAALMACTSGPQPGPAARDPVQQPPGEARRTLVISVRVEPQTIAAKSLQQAGVTLETSRRLFNAGVALLDSKGGWHPYLVEAIPALDTASWQVEPDGRMVTTFRLRSNVIWHDGTPLSAEDFVFAYQVYATPDLGQSRSTPMSVMADVVATGDRTFEVRWLRPYAQADVVGAGSGGGGEFGPLPRHLLADSFRDASGSGAFDAFAGHPYWTRDYVGLGPYRLDRWEPGAFIEAVAFGGHILGRPKIERVKMVFISDANTTLSNTLAGEVHFASDDSIRFEQTRVLMREWGPRSGGMILSKPNLWRASYFQLRPEVASPRAILDLRVRRALAHAIDRIALNDAMFEGANIVGDTIVAPSVSYYAELERSITKYPYDLRRSEQLMR